MCSECRGRLEILSLTNWVHSVPYVVRLGLHVSCMRWPMAIELMGLSHVHLHAHVYLCLLLAVVICICSVIILFRELVSVMPQYVLEAGHTL